MKALLTASIIFCFFSVTHAQWSQTKQEGNSELAFIRSNIKPFLITPSKKNMTGSDLFLSRRTESLAKTKILDPKSILTGVPYTVQVSHRFTESRFYLENKKNKHRRVKIPNKKITLQIDESSKVGLHLSRLNSVECILDSISADSAFVTLISEEIDEEFRNHFSNTNISYFVGKYSKVQKSVSKADILYLSMKSPLRQTISQTGSVLMASAILLIISSPFVGLQLQGNARTEARERVFTTGISCFAISLPFFVIGKNKKYVLSSTYKTRKSNYWSLQIN